ncbi:hypothetical protein PVAND_008121 [Polypedilum vanderplanki]|uniref:RING-type E3 ubiquitin transferase n=1 Tax=Polypedilum vanderplanki TaxID=319348 RepID=A0A9J6C8R0_POLVA|nr:hypothetical protein PVAND_008121 [Polypedilum vanderplanki]
MSENVEQASQKQSDNEHSCVVCFKPTLIFSIGSCNHPVCYECSARMRVLCMQNECPICRQDLPKVIFTKSIDLYATLDRNTRTGLFEKKFRIVFSDHEIQKAFYHLLANRCPRCSEEEQKPFADFQKLKEHVRKAHELYYCEICTENLKIFSSERRCYTRQQLALHRRVGDPDDKSHRGHPRCDYCELRYLDKDELFRHLRREHYYCHLCDADGINLFYGTVNEMRDHFKAEHFLCEEDECIEEEFTAVFRTEIDLRAHKATVHSKTMSRTEARQARILEIDISYGPRGSGRGAGGGGDTRGGGRIRTNDTQREFDINPEIVQHPPIQIDTKNEEHFPSLAGPSTSLSNNNVQLANSVRHVVYGQAGLARTKENFPALGQEKSIKNQASSKKQNNQNSLNKQSGPTTSSLFKASSTSSVKTPINNQSKSNSSKSTSYAKDSISDFPSLPQNSTSSSSYKQPQLYQQQQKQSQQNSTPAKISLAKKDIASEYPSLPNSSSKKSRDLLMEDMVLPTNNIEKGLISSKHRTLVNDYVSVASQMTKVNIVKQKDETIKGENSQKSVPKLNSMNNFPTLGGNGESSSNPQWITVKNNNNSTVNKVNLKQQKVDPSTKKKQNEVPLKNQKNNTNGMKKEKNEAVKKEKEVVNKKDDSSKENQSILSLNQQLSKPPPPGFKQIESSAYSRFTPVPDANKRNQALVEEFQQILKTNEQMQEFRLLSQMFRDGNYFARTLLPDIEKQQKLYRIYLEDLSENREIENNITKKMNKKSQKTLDVCNICKQVLLTKDLSQHIQTHSLENGFPTLSN